jgi:starch-binding outer membrane protein, SusD/RagB family
MSNFNHQKLKSKIMKLSVITSYIFVLIIALTFGSCSGVLDEEPTTFYSEDQIYVSPEGAETAINGLYYSLGTFEYYGSNYINLILPHSGLFWSSQAANVDVAGLNATPSNINVNSSWEGQFKTINAANIAIKNLEAKDANFKNKPTLLGHAYFIRGKVYLDLLRMYGGVPLRTEPSTVSTIHLARATKEQVTDLIVADLNKAKSLMPDNGELGRPAKYAAHAYLAKLYMFLAQDDGANWQKAYDELLPIINSTKYSLLPSYASLFQPGNENTKESLFEIQYGHTGGSRTSDLPRLFTPSNSIYAPANTTTFGRIRPNKEVYDEHKSRYADDPRLTATFVVDEYLKTDGTKQKIYPKQKTGNNGFAVIAKWFDPTFTGVTSNRNYILLRYADVLLMMAEVVNEINGPDAAYGYVNQVLTRARMSTAIGTPEAMSPANYANMTKEEFRDRIMFERRYELLSEGEDWFDTRRRGLDFFLKTVVNLHNANPKKDPERDYVYPLDARNMLLPIPLTEISGNQEIGPEDQNPGY